MRKKENEFYEYFAKHHLESLYKAQNLCFRKSESPDFLSEGNAIGLEVTRAYIKKWKQLDSIVEKYFGKGLSFKEIRSRVDGDCKNGFDGELINLDGMTAYSPIKGMYNTKIHEQNIIERIIEKTKMLDNYEECYEFWLYIWNFYMLVDEGTIRRVNEFYLKMKQSIQFLKIFIRVGEDLYLLQKGKPVEIYKTNQTTYNEMRKLALVEAGLPELIDK